MEEQRARARRSGARGDLGRGGGDIRDAIERAAARVQELIPTQRATDPVTGLAVDAEWGGWIVRFDDGGYGYTEPVTSARGGSIHPGAMAQALAGIAGATAIMPYHSHPSSSSFSASDYLVLGRGPYQKPGPQWMSVEEMAGEVTGKPVFAPGQLLFGHDGSVRYVGRPTSMAPWLYNLRAAGKAGRPAAPPGVDPGRPSGSASGGTNQQPPETSSSASQNGSSNEGRPNTNGPKDNTFPASPPGTTASTTPTATPTTSGGTAKPPETKGARTGGSTAGTGEIGTETVGGDGVEKMGSYGTATIKDGKAVKLDEAQPTATPPEEPATGGDDDDDDAGKSGSGNGEVGGYVDPNDPNAGGGDESWRFHSNYLPLETRALLGIAELGRAHAPERPAPPGGGPTDRGGWKPVRARGAAATHPPEGPPGGNRLQNALVDDAASRLMGGARIPRMGTDGPGQVPLNAAALAKAARPVLRTVGDAEEAAAKASRDEVRQLLYNEHVAPIVRLTNQMRDAGVRARAR